MSADEALTAADFFLNDSDSPLSPPEGFSAWRQKTEFAHQLFERVLCAAPSERTVIRLPDGHEREAINLTSYNYLGLATHPQVIQSAKEILERWGTGACGSPLLSGLTPLHEALAERLSGLYQGEDRAALLYSTGFSGALGMIAGLLRRDDVAVLDQLSHISLADGARASNAKLITFKHNDPDSLDQRAEPLSRAQTAGDP